MSGTLRPPSYEDLAFVVRLLTRDAPEPMDEETVRREWTSPVIDLELDARVDDHSYALVEGLDDGRAWIAVAGRPSPAMLDWAESRAREVGERALCGAWSANRPLLDELVRRGYELARHSHRMESDLAAPVPNPVWPDGVTVRTFRGGDERAFYEIHQETFADMWEAVSASYEEWAHWLLQPPAFAPDFWFLAVTEAGPAGFAICNPHPVKTELGYIRSLGVRRAWRKRGLGRALLLHAFGEFRKHGLVRTGLGVDADSLTGAHRLYERVGMQAVARFDTYRRELA